MNAAQKKRNEKGKSIAITENRDYRYSLRDGRDADTDKAGSIVMPKGRETVDYIVFEPWGVEAQRDHRAIPSTRRA